MPADRARPRTLPQKADAPIGELRWRCRAGLLENDLFIERFFRRHEETLTPGRRASGLMDLADNDCWTCLLARKEPEGELATPEVREVLACCVLGTSLNSNPT
jgi:antitoxin CptB